MSMKRALLLLAAAWVAAVAGPARADLLVGQTAGFTGPMEL